MNRRIFLSSLLALTIVANTVVIALAPAAIYAENLPSTPTVSNTGTLPTGNTGSNPSSGNSGNIPPLSVSGRTGSGPVKSTAASFGGCFAGGVLTQAVKNLIDTGIKNAVKAVANLKSGPLKSFLGGILGNVPVTDPSTQDNFAAFTDAQTRNAILTRCAAMAIMTNMTNNIMTVVRTGGREGGPTYVRNWTNFQTNAQYRGENIFRAELSTAKLCNYLSTDVKKSFGVDPKTKTPITGQNTRTDSFKPFSLATQCTMPAGFTPQKYQQDFAGNGGWDTFSRMLEPQNNLMGLTALSLNEAQKQRALAEKTDVNQVLANQGMTGISGNGKKDSCQIMGPTGMCLTFKDIKTAGNFLAQNVGATIGAQFAWLTSAQGLNTIISDATEVMLNRLLDFGNKDEGNYHNANDTGAAYNPTPTNLTIPGVTNPTTPTAPTAGNAQCLEGCIANGGSPTQCAATCSTPTDTPPASLKSQFEVEKEKYSASDLATCDKTTGEEPPTCPMGAILNAVAWNNRDLGWGLSRKTSGHRTPSPAGLIATDILHHQPTNTLYDVFSWPNVTWNNAGPPQSPDRIWVAPVQP